MSVSDNFDIFEDVVYPLGDAALTELSTDLSTGDKPDKTTRAKPSKKPRQKKESAQDREHWAVGSTYLDGKKKKS